MHARDARAKLIALLVVLVAIALSPRDRLLPLVPAAAFVAAGLLLSRLPFGGALQRAAVVLPFTLPFALLSWWAGDRQTGATLVLRAYVSALAVLLVVATTPWPRLLHALRSLGAPRILVVVIQFLYRYLFVISDQAVRIAQAASSRGGKRQGFSAAAGMAAVLFGKSYQRAEGLHHAMLSRGFRGEVPVLEAARVTPGDAALFALALACAAWTVLWR